MSCTVRRAQSADYGALTELLEQVDRLHRERLPHLYRRATGPARSREYVEGLLADPQALVLLAEIEGRPAGCLIASLRPTSAVPIIVPRRVVSIDALVVDAAVRRQGVGRALMAAAYDWAVANDADDLELGVYEFNAGAIAFYQALGYGNLVRRMARRVEKGN